jgi:type VI secretion system protein ImpE
MDVSEGPEGDVYLPCLYAGSHERDDQIRLGRATDWTADDQPPVQGAGLRMFLVGDGDKSILEINELQFEVD